MYVRLPSYDNTKYMYNQGKFAIKEEMVLKNPYHYFYVTLYPLHNFCCVHVIDYMCTCTHTHLCPR